MRKPFILIILMLLLCVPVVTVAQAPPETDTAAKDEAVIAVMEILELMEMVGDMTLFKEMEYLMEEDPNEPQK